MGREDYITSIVNDHRIYNEAKASERQHRIAQVCANKAARNPELIDEIYNSVGDTNDADASDSDASCS